MFLSGGVGGTVCEFGGCISHYAIQFCDLVARKLLAVKK